MRKTITYITTADTKKTYEYPDLKSKNPQLWAVKLSITWVGNTGRHGDPDQEKTVIYLERETLENVGLLPAEKKLPESTPEPQETVEDLILRLLEHVGIFPAE